jgi:hypothetical protein
MYAVTVWKEWTLWRGRGRPVAVDAHELGELHGYNQDGALRAAREQRRELHRDRFFLFFLFRPGSDNAVCKDMPSNYTKILTNFAILYIKYKEQLNRLRD